MTANVGLEWWDGAEVAWVEDDALTHDREHIEDAWLRLFGERLVMVDAVRKVDHGDAVFYDFGNGRMACLSYPGANEIRVKKYEPPKVELVDNVNDLLHHVCPPKGDE